MIFLTKVPSNLMREDREASLKRLGTDYIDFTDPRNVEYMRAPKSKFLSVSFPNQERRS
jgi:aryl-alcohol dehydrogenase-like predicted oxidoreductase